MNKEIIYDVLCGSHAYGTATPESDKDTRGIWLPTLEEHLQLGEPGEIRNDAEDTVYYPIKQFFKLASQCNPNVIEFLYVPENCILKMTYKGKIIRNNRAIFLGAEQIYNRFRGYAQGEFLAISKVNRTTGAKRKAQIEEYGYSPKNAMNMVRLMEEAIEYLRYSECYLPRKNADYLMAIKTAKVSYEEVARKYVELNAELDKAYAETKLPQHNSLETINKLLVQIIKG